MLFHYKGVAVLVDRSAIDSTVLPSIDRRSIDWCDNPDADLIKNSMNSKQLHFFTVIRSCKYNKIAKRINKSQFNTDVGYLI